MTVTTVYNTVNTVVDSISTTWATVRDATSGSVSTGPSSTLGAYLSSGSYYCYQVLHDYDVSSVTGSVSAVTLNTYLSSASESGYGFSARIYDFGSTVEGADYSSRADLSGYTEIATLPPTSTTGWKTWTSTASTNSFVENATNARMALASLRQISDYTPTGATYLSITNNTNISYLSITWSTPVEATMSAALTVTASATAAPQTAATMAASLTATASASATAGVQATLAAPITATASANATVAIPVTASASLSVNSSFTPTIYIPPPTPIYTALSVPSPFMPVPVSPLRFAATDIITGKTLSDNIPFSVSSFSDALGTDGSMDATLNLSNREASAFVSVLIPRKTIIWVFDGNQPIWHGILWDIPHSSVNGNAIPYSIKTVGTLFARRIMHDNIKYTQQDPGYILRELVSYAVNKRNGSLHNLIMDETLLHTKIDRTYGGENHTTIIELMGNLSATNDLEWRFAPYIDGSTVGTRLRIGTPKLGKSSGRATLTLVYPGNVKDYAYSTSGSNSFNSVRAIGDPSASGQQFISSPTSGLYQTDLDNGYPLLEGLINLGGSGIVNLETLNSHADDKVRETARNVIGVRVIVSGRFVSFRDFELGDYVNLNLTSPMHPMVNGKPGLSLVTRIVGYSATVTNGCISEIELNMGDL